MDAVADAEYRKILQVVGQYLAMVSVMPVASEVKWEDQVHHLLGTVQKYIERRWWNLALRGDKNAWGEEGDCMPSVSRKQQKFMGVQLAKKRAGKPTDVDMSEAELEKMASTKHKGLPEKKKATK